MDFEQFGGAFGGALHELAIQAQVVLQRGKDFDAAFGAIVVLLEQPTDHGVARPGHVMGRGDECFHCAIL
ncbi:hypothetical protein D3C71_2196590 [compost metagenome]